MLESGFNELDGDISGLCEEIARGVRIRNGRPVIMLNRPKAKSVMRGSGIRTITPAKYIRA